MSLRAGFNIVSEPIDESLEEMTALSFFRALEHGEPLPSWVTVRGFEQLLQFTAEDDRDEVLAYLNRLLSRATSGELIGVQFVIDGDVQKDTHVYITLANANALIYIDGLFREQPTRISPTHFHSRHA